MPRRALDCKPREFRDRVWEKLYVDGESVRQVVGDAVAESLVRTFKDQTKIDVTSRSRRSVDPRAEPDYADDLGMATSQLAGPARDRDLDQTGISREDPNRTR